MISLVYNIVVTCIFRAVGCIFGELLNNSPLFPVSTQNNTQICNSGKLSVMSPSTLLIDQRFSYFCAKGENDIEQLCCVLRVLGTPSEESWPVSKLFFLHCNPNKNVCTEMRGPLSHVPVRWGPISRGGCRVWGHAVQ